MGDLRLVGNSALFALVDTAKNALEQDVANLAFAVLLWRWLEGDTKLHLEIETQDTAGVDYLEAYYDLVVLRDGTGNYACIPLPLLHPQAIATIYKRGVSQVERRDHQTRDHSQPHPGWLTLVSSFLEDDKDGGDEWWRIMDARSILLPEEDDRRPSKLDSLIKEISEIPEGASE